MSTEQHEALRTADQVADLCRRFKTPSHERGVCNGATQMIRTQHALIVQMAEALDGMSRIYPPTDGARNAHAAATQYLKGPKT